MWRVARRSWPRQPSTISARDAELPRSGNRSTCPTLVFSTSPPTSEADSPRRSPGSGPPRPQPCAKPPPRTPTSTLWLGVLAAELHQLGVENLDVSTIRGPDRRVTRLVSLWAYMPRAEVRRGVRRHPLRVTSRTVGVLGCLRRCSRGAGRAAADRAGRPGDALGRQRLWVANLLTPCRAKYVRRAAATPRPTHGSAERHEDSCRSRQSGLFACSSACPIANST